MSVPSPLSSPVQYLKGIGEKRAALFASLGIYTVADLLSFYPRAYDDFTVVSDSATAPADRKCFFHLTVISEFSCRRTHNGKSVYSAVARDKSGFVGLVFFNNEYITRTVHSGSGIFAYGKIRINSDGTRELINPEVFGETSGTPSLRAVYPLTAGLTGRVVSGAVKTALETCSGAIAETLPAEQIEKYRLKTLRDAIRLIHFPETQEDVKAARRRLIYEELLTLQLGMLLRSGQDRGSTGCHIPAASLRGFDALLPYSLTNAQKRSLKECLSDMGSNRPMRRLLQGDVGSGKTAVAAGLMYGAAKSGFQSVLMAPTEVLARQHFDNLTKTYKNAGITVGLLTGSLTAKEKKTVKQQLLSGEINVLVGTHAVLTDDTVFARLGLVITDEQHRFGVIQRAALREKGDNPHVLVMSATPIPRTLSLIIYADLDISIIDEKPAGRQEIKTYLVDSSYSARLNAFIQKRASLGERTFIICPLIENAEDDDGISPKKAAEDYAAELKKNGLASLRIGTLHGKMRPKEKNAVMAAFAAGGLDVLVSTVVVEVGVDVPEATVMVIQNAECFGLAQLHQLRGRVGRGDRQSYCVLVSDGSKESLSRLDVLCKSTDGFEIARRDLEMRGPGDFFGSRQSGLPSLKLSDLMTDSQILYAARTEAESILRRDPLLKNPAYAGLKSRAEEMFTDIS